jgi:G:T-mismatch repair DNA endonuclease (very short patch repair protein)
MLEIAIEENTRLCKECNTKLGYFEDKKTKRTFKRQYFSILPITLDGIEYYRCICVDCFIKKYERLPKSPNVPNYDFEYLLGIERSILDKECKKRGYTKEKCIKKFGEKEGIKRWNSYCKKQSDSNTFEYKNEKYGMTEEDFKLYNSNRATTKENCIRRYGYEEGIIRWNSYCEKQAYAGNKKEYFIEIMGKVEGTKRWVDVCNSKVQSLENFNKRYGEEGEIKYKKYLLSLKKDLYTYIKKHGEEEGILRHEAFVKSRRLPYSKGSQELSWMIYKELSYKLREKCYFAELNHEFGYYSKLNKQSFMYDFVLSSIGFVLEYNGDLFHGNPKMFKPYDKPNPYNDLYAKDIWEYDFKKRKCLEELSFKVFYVWESDFMNNKEETVNQVLKQIKEMEIL